MEHLCWELHDISSEKLNDLCNSVHVWNNTIENKFKPSLKDFINYLSVAAISLALNWLEVYCN